MNCGKKHGLRKSEKKGEPGRKVLCKSIMHACGGCGLWKTLVEKAVENVENKQFSTGIWLLNPLGFGCGKVCIPVCIKQVTKWLQARYVTGQKLHSPGERKGKS